MLPWFFSSKWAPSLAIGIREYELISNAFRKPSLGVSMNSPDKSSLLAKAML